MRQSTSSRVFILMALCLVALLSYSVYITVFPLASGHVSLGTIADIRRPNGPDTAYAMVVREEHAGWGEAAYFVFDLPEDLPVYEVERFDGWHPDEQNRSDRGKLRPGQTVKVSFTARTADPIDPTKMPGLIKPEQVQFLTSHERG